MQINSHNIKEYCSLQGRTYFKDDQLFLNHTLSSVEGIFVGDKISFDLSTEYEKSIHATFIKVFIDGKPQKFHLKRGENHIEVETTFGEHTFKLVKLTESKRNSLGVRQIAAEKFKKYKNTKTLNIEFIGDSITAGYGIMSRRQNGKYKSKHQDPTYSFPFKVASKLNANFNVVASSGHGIGVTKDADVSLLSLYENIDLYRNQEKWDETTFEPKIDIIELGINDFIYYKTLSESEYNRAILQFEDTFYKFLKQLLAKKRKIILVYGFFGFKNLKNSIQNIYKKLNSKDVYLVETIDINLIGDLHAWHPGRKTNTITTNRILKVIKDNNLTK